ncbi:nucleotidyl cyclase domain-containing protein [Facilibium subflavum]|uniref:diguanylate cyclase n=1 Tax=Facilibium subflavum TaxID=2219058 RepID=UPI000E6466E5|nr:diguanylate cyclase [Facilibium subflavum]
MIICETQNEFIKASKCALSLTKRLGSHFAIAALYPHGTKNSNICKVGSPALIGIKDILYKHLREMDLLYCHQGFLYIALIHLMDSSDLREILDRLLEQLSDQMIPDSLETMVMSIGVSSYPEISDTIPTLMKTASQAAKAAYASSPTYHCIHYYE